MDFSQIAGSEEELINYMSYFMIANGILVVFILTCTSLNAPYGRYSSSNWGFLLNGKLAWVIQEIPALLIPLYCMFAEVGDKMKNLPNLVLITMYCVHYFQRACIFPLLIKGGKPTPFVPFFLALFFCIYNGYMQGRFLSHFASYPEDWLTQPRTIAGLALFAFGMLINIHSDHILRNLRKPGETGYKIPKGGAFNFVSGANFFGECLEWSGFAVACWSLPATAFAIFTIFNIGPRALQHHQWYLSKFKEEYPKKQKGSHSIHSVDMFEAVIIRFIAQHFIFVCFDFFFCIYREHSKIT